MVSSVGMNTTSLVTLRDRRNQLTAALRDNLTARKTIRAQLALANAQLEQAIGDLGGATAPDPVLTVAPVASVATRESIQDRRRVETEAQAVRVLTAAGGSLANKDLASLLGVSPHGLEGLLRGSTRVEKVHDGRIGNEVTTWVIKK